MLRKPSILAIAVFMGLHLGLSPALSPAHYSLQLLGATLLGGVAFLLMTISIVLSTRAKPTWRHSSAVWIACIRCAHANSSRRP